MIRCLTVYDVTGIQEFIFASNKAKENIGGSIYVQTIFEDGLVNCIKALGDNVKTDWKGSQELSYADHSKAEIVYIGGGNAMVLFDKKETAVDITKKLSKKILEETQGTLGVAIAYHETDMKNFAEDKDKLFKALNKKKQSSFHSTPLRGISITRECEDGLPTSGRKSEKENGVYISDIAHKKRELAEKENSQGSIFSSLLPQLPDGKVKMKFPIEFDDLGRMEGESHIAVIHIDGNSMGRFIDDKLSQKSDYKDAVPVIREISEGLQNLYSGVFKKMVDACRKGMENKDVQKRIQLKENILPIRPVILNGDDVTFVCDGRIGIQLADFFLKELAKTPLQLKSGEENMSACAGVAIVKSHFPFFRAYELAEALCASAKKKAKTFNNIEPGCWMDYHIVYSGFQTDLDALRKGQYNIPGMDAVSRDVKKKFNQYNLLLRPFCISGNADVMYQWSNMKILYSQMRNSQMRKIPRSRLKSLRNSFFLSKEDAELQQAQNTSRNHLLPEYNMGDLVCKNDILFAENQTPYFEPLELLDYYLPEFELEFSIEEEGTKS